jgi:hypothetical protein
VVAAYGLLYTLCDAVAGLSWTLCLALPLWKLAHAIALQVRSSALLGEDPLA